MHGDSEIVHEVAAAVTLLLAAQAEAFGVSEDDEDVLPALDAGDDIAEAA